MKCCKCKKTIANIPELPIPTLCGKCEERQHNRRIRHRIAKMSDDALMKRIVEHRVPENKLDEHCFEILPRGRENILKVIRDKGEKLVDIGFSPTSTKGFHEYFIIYE